MRKTKWALLTGVAIALTACGSAPEKPEIESGMQEASIPTNPEELNSLEFEYLDRSADPKQDFYQFANGTWLANNPIPEEESRWSSFNVLNKSNNELIRVLLMDVASEDNESGSSRKLLADFYRSYMDTVERDSAGIRPIEMEIDYINSIDNVDGFTNVIARHHRLGIGSFFRFSIQQDLKDNTRYVTYLSQGGLGLPNRDSYFNTDERSKKIRTAYLQHIRNIFQLSKMEITSSDAQKIYTLEKRLAEASMTPVELRDEEKKYNVYTLGKLEDEIPDFKWARYFTKIGLTRTDKIIVNQPEFLKKTASILNNTAPTILKKYMLWRLLNNTSGGLTTAHEAENFHFYGTVMRGREKMKPYWKNAIENISWTPLGEALGKEFVDMRFSPEAKKKVNEMVDNITAVFNQRISELDWMSNATKDKAKEKLQSFTRKLGFPDHWRDYSGLEMDAKNFPKNTLALYEFEFDDKLKKLNKAIDKSEWHMAPHIVNAYYNPVLNEIVFPAGIMQNPFFDVTYEDAVNYARMGAVIGHELTHGFDDQGARYTADGRLENWWTKEDSIKFAAKTQKLIDQYNEFEVLDDVFVNGKLTLGENIADLGGLTIAYHAYLKSLEGQERKKIDGFTNEQRFFLAFAQVWKNNIRDDALQMRIQTDPHSPGKYRVNGTLANMPEFFEAFDVQEDDAMRQSPDKIAKIW